MKTCFHLLPGKKNEFLIQLDNELRKTDRPFSFEPLGLVFNQKIECRGIYGNIYENSFWLRAYNQGWYEARLPGRYCLGQIDETNEETIILVTWRITPYWPVMFGVAYLIAASIVGLASFAGAAMMILFLTAFILIMLLGIRVHKNEERQVIALVKSLCDTVNLK